MAKLDKSKPYGQVSGEHNGACFEQAGVLFDVHGNELTAGKAAKAEPVAAEKPKAARGKAAKAEPEAEVVADLVASAVDAQLAAQGA